MSVPDTSGRRKERSEKELVERLMELRRGLVGLRPGTSVRAHVERLGNLARIVEGVESEPSTERTEGFWRSGR